MLSTLYWTVLVLGTVGLVFLGGSPQIAPLMFLGGAAILGAVYGLLRLQRRLSVGHWEPGRYTIKVVGTVFVYVAVYWTTLGLFTNVKDHREFLMRYEPNIQNGVQRGYTFYYVDYDGCFERIDSPDLNAFLEKNHPDKVHMVLELVRDFGKLRSYSVIGVESVTVFEGWLGLESEADRNPPWEALRQLSQ